ncbi:MAG: hypothetical protein H0T89_17605 [Deltaproteobacteria bacterium]|nr:hypothetical protein [Deltaproteobacteria bacterium]MDQ3295709.1 hypothetical protein [Myxococcota bacterium]
MKTTIALALVLATVATSGCGKDSGGDDGDGGVEDRTFDQCDGDAPSFVRQAFLALAGRRPKSAAEVQVYADLYAQAVEQEADPNDVVARAIMNRPEFAERWVDVIMDALHVQRLDIQSEQSCWDESLRGTISPALAIAVRDKPAAQTADGASFTMLDLARSAIALDDLTPIYRAQLFSLISHPQPAANVGVVEAELARREDFGATFDASYLHRDSVCLGCHNSEGAVTDSDDPDHDRHWPVPGSPEQAIYGIATGISAERAHAVFRVEGFVDNGESRPWGWTSACGTFAAPGSLGDDPAGVDGKLGTITGKRATVHDLEASLARGFAGLRASGAPTGPIADPDVALAWLVTLKTTEDIWKQATGTTLTIANYFPRNQASSELLYALASRYVASGFSLKTLLVAIVSSDYFNRLPPEAQCGAHPYTYPAVFDPWVTADADPARHGNGPGDAVTAVDARTLVSATNAALEWGAPPMATRFPDYGERGCENASCTSLAQACTNLGQCCTTHTAACRMNGVLPQLEVPFQRAVGIFLRNSERGFRGLDFQARLAWEDRYGACTKPRWVDSDFIDRLVAAAGASGTVATTRDLVVALKDRLIGEPTIADGAETDALIAIAGDLAGPATGVTADVLRRVCGALIESPQFVLQGIAGRGGDLPVLTPPDASYDAICTDLATTGIGVAGKLVTCVDGKATLVAGRMQAAPAVTVPAVREITRRGGMPDLRQRAPM